MWASAALGQNGRPAPQRTPGQPGAQRGSNGAGAAAGQPAANAAAAIAQPGAERKNGNGPIRKGPVKEGKVVLAFNDVEVTEIIPWIVETTGKVVIPVQATGLKAKHITLMNDEPVDHAIALDLLFTAMRLNGVGIIETDEVVILDAIENIKPNELPVLSSEDDVMGLKNPGQLIVKIYRLREAQAEGVHDKLLNDKMPDYALLDVDANSNQIILYGDVGLAQHIQRLINELDHNHVVIKTETFTLDYADAQGVADQIDELFNDTGTAGQSGSRQTTRQGGRNAQRGQAGGGGPQNQGQTGTPGPAVEMRISVNVQQNSVTVSAEPVKIDAIAKLIEEEWDLPRAEETAKVYQLKYTDPLKVVELLQNLLGGGGGGAARASSRAGGAAARTAQGAQGGAGGSVSQAIGDIYRIEAYPDQNMLVVLSKTKDALHYLDYIIEAIDQPSMIGLPHVEPLKHANAIEVANELNILLAEAGTGGGLEAPEKGLTGEGLSGVGESGGGGSGDTTGGTGGAAAGTIEFPWQRGRQRDDQSEPSPLIGKVRIVPIIRQNALAILAPLAQLPSVIRLVQEFDQPGRQVMISAVIAEVELTDDLALGLRFSSQELISTIGDNAFRAGGEITATEDDIFGSLFNTSVLDVNANINVLLEALRQKTNVRILQEPRVFTADNQEAIFFDGQDVPFITQSNSNSVSGFQQNFDYQAVGVQLDVRPRITAQRDVDMRINLELSSIVPGETLFGGFILDRRETSTNVIVKNGQTIVLSGILTDSESQVKRGIPLLSELPLIGDLFASHSTNKVTTELIAFITPVVVDNPSENYDKNRPALERLQELSKPLKQQGRQRSAIRDQIVAPKSEHEPIVPTPELVDEAEEDERDKDRKDSRGSSQIPRDGIRQAPKPAPIDIDDLAEEPSSQ